MIKSTKLTASSLFLSFLANTYTNCFTFTYISKSQSIINSRKKSNILAIYNNDPNNNNIDDHDQNNNNNQDINAFYQDLQKAKSDKIGVDILSSSSTQIQESIRQSESEFFSAMKQVKQDFEKSKGEYGVDGAIDLLKQGWDLEDRLWELELEKEDIMLEEDDDINNENEEDHFQ